MKINRVASIYSKVFLEFISDYSFREVVLVEVKKLSMLLDKLPELRDALADDAKDIALQEKIKLLCIALEKESLEPKFEDFIKLLDKKSRLSDLKLILINFLDLYNKKYAIKEVRLVAACDSPDLDSKISELIKSKFACSQIILHKEIEPSLIGGFVLYVDDIKIDKSVISKIREIRYELVGKNRL